MDKVNSASNCRSTKSKSLVFSFLVISIGLLAILNQFTSVNCAPFNDELNKQSLIDAIISLYHDSNAYSRDLENDYSIPHTMVRKGGRAPQLRLRFGRRSDPAWAPSLLSKLNSQENVN